MIIPSIDIRRGRAVQLIGGKAQALDGGDPLEVAERFSIAGPLAVIDLDAAFGEGDNLPIIEQLVRRYPCRVGGGIRSKERALELLDLGAEQIILGTAATPELLGQLPRDRLIAALDAIDGKIVVDGWREQTEQRTDARLVELRDYVCGFLLTFVEHEGRMQGTDLARAKTLVDLAQSAKVTIAGGITTAEEIATLDAMGADAQVGMAIYRGTLKLGDAISACLRSDRPDGLWPTVVCDDNGRALGLCYSSAESLRIALDEQRGVYHSRRRGVWRKGESSANRQRLLRVDVDCDRDTLRFVVEQQGSGFCHRDTRSCWTREDDGLGALQRRLLERKQSAPAGSYSRKLLDDRQLLSAKLLEEAEELAQAATRDEVIWEAADLIFFTQVAMTSVGVTLADVDRELQRRALRVRRRD
ncbi:MAG: phosphoribosyl-ATP diphosphatase [Deltaproteobacteria bacterium]|nr:phosphoribosyl-ATP diphosphatase [Deltaproteobacteria bacterium]